MFSPADAVWDFLADTSNVAWGRQPSRLTGLEAPTTLPALSVVPIEYDPQATTLELAAEGAFAYQIMLFLSASDTSGYRYHTEPNNPDSFVSRCLALQNEHLECGRVRLTTGVTLEAVEFSHAGAPKSAWAVSCQLVVLTNRALGIVSVPTITASVSEALRMPEGAQEQTRIGELMWGVSLNPFISDSERDRARASVQITSDVLGVSVDGSGNVLYTGDGFDFEAQQAQSVEFTFSLTGVPGVYSTATTTLQSSITITDVLDTPQTTIGEFTSIPTIEQNAEFVEGVLGAVVAEASSSGGPVGARTYRLVVGPEGYSVNAVTGEISYSGAPLTIGTAVELTIEARWAASGLAMSASTTAVVSWSITAPPLEQLPSTIEITRAPSFILNERLQGPVDVGEFSAVFQTEGSPGALTFSVTAGDSHTEDDDWRWHDGQIEYLGAGIDHDVLTSVDVNVRVTGAATPTAEAPDAVEETISVAVQLVPRATIIAAQSAQTLSLQEHTTGVVGNVVGTALCNTDESVDVVFTPIGADWGTHGLSIDANGVVSAAQQVDYATIQQISVVVQITTVASARCAAAVPVEVSLTIQIVDDESDNQPQVPIAQSVVFSRSARSIAFFWAAPNLWGDELGSTSSRRFELQHRAESASDWTDAPSVSYGSQQVFTLANVPAGDSYLFRVRAVNADGVASAYSQLSSEHIRYAPVFQLASLSAQANLPENTPGRLEIASGLPVASIAADNLVAEFAPVVATIQQSSSPQFEFSSTGDLTYTGTGEDYETGSLQRTVRVVFSVPQNNYHLAGSSSELVITINVVNSLLDNVPEAPTALSHTQFSGVSGFSWSSPTDWRDVRGTQQRMFSRRIDDHASVLLPGTSSSTNVIWDLGQEIESGSTHTLGLTAINAYGVLSQEATLQFSTVHAPTLTQTIPDFTGYTISLAENLEGTPADPLILQSIAAAVPALDARSVELGLSVSASLSGVGSDRFRIVGTNLEYIGGTEDFESVPSYSLTATYSVSAGQLNTAANYSYPISVNIADVNGDAPPAPTGLSYEEEFAMTEDRLTFRWAQQTDWGGEAVGADTSARQYAYSIVGPNGMVIMSGVVSDIAEPETPFISISSSGNPPGEYSVSVTAENASGLRSSAAELTTGSVLLTPIIDNVLAGPTIEIPEEVAGPLPTPANRVYRDRATLVNTLAGATLPAVTPTLQSGAPAGFQLIVEPTRYFVQYAGDGIDFETEDTTIEVVVEFVVSANSNYRSLTGDTTAVWTFNVLDSVMEAPPSPPTRLRTSAFNNGDGFLRWSAPTRWNDGTPVTPNRRYRVMVGDSYVATTTSITNNVPAAHLPTGVAQSVQIVAINTFGVESAPLTGSIVVQHTPVLTEGIPNFSGFLVAFNENVVGTPDNPLVLRSVAQGVPTLDARSIELGLQVVVTLQGVGAERFRITAANDLEYIGGSEDFETTSFYSLTARFEVPAGTPNRASNTVAWPLEINIQDVDESVAPTAPELSGVAAVVSAPVHEFASESNGQDRLVDLSVYFAFPMSVTTREYTITPVEQDSIGVTVHSTNGAIVLLRAQSATSLRTGTASYNILARNTATSESVSTTLTLTLTPPPAVAQSLESATLGVGATRSVPISAAFGGLPDSPVASDVFSWSGLSDDTDVVSVETTSEGWTLTAEGAGSAIITFTLVWYGVSVSTNVAVSVPDPPTDPPYGTFLGEIAVPGTAGSASVGGLVLAPRGANVSQLELLVLPGVPSSSSPAELYDVFLVRNSDDSWSLTMSASARRTYTLGYTSAPRPRGAATINSTLGDPAGDGSLGAGGRFYIGDFRLDNITEVNVSEGATNAITAAATNVLDSDLDNVRQIYHAQTGTESPIVWGISNHADTAAAYVGGTRTPALDISIANAELDGVTGDYGSAVGSKVYIYDRVANQVSRWTIQSATSVTRDTGADFALTAPHPTEVRHIVFVGGVLFTCQQSRTAVNHFAAYWVGE